MAYTKARLKSVLPTEKKKKKESQVHKMQWWVCARNAIHHELWCFQVSQAPLIVQEVVTIEGEVNKPRRWSQVCLFFCFLFVLFATLFRWLICLFYLRPCLLASQDDSSSGCLFVWCWHRENELFERSKFEQEQRVSTGLVWFNSRQTIGNNCQQQPLQWPISTLP